MNMLLLGHSIQDQYHLRHSSSKSYEEILNQEIIRPVNMKHFSSKKPDHAMFNERDPAAAHIVGGPAGGHWTTTRDLMKFGKWINEKCQSENFRELVKKYGEEFYEEGEIRHGGDTYSASSYFSTFLDSGITISILSDQGQSMAARMFEDIMDYLYSF